MTPKTWDEVVEIAERAYWRNLVGNETRMGNALHALRAAGLAVVPREATEAMVSEAWDAHADGAPCELIANPRQIYEALNAALSAGELAPPDKGEG